MPSQKEFVERAIEALENIDPNDPASADLATYLYIADRRLSDYIDQLKEFIELENPTLSESKKGGELLEQIAFLVFQGLKGVTSLKSFQSAGPQYDLLVSGNKLDWLYVCNLLYLKENQRGIVVEAKATKQRLPDKQFARLCSIMELNLSITVGLGVFFTLNGATGFPQNESSKQRSIRDCRLRQVLFHAKTQKLIVVLDKDDIFELGKNGTLLEILGRKIRDLCELSGLPTTPICEPKEIVLPKHLRELYEDSDP